MNRKTRVRHADPSCKAIRLSALYLEGDHPDTERKRLGRIFEMPERADESEVRAIAQF